MGGICTKQPLVKNELIAKSSVKNPRDCVESKQITENILKTRQTSLRSESSTNGLNQWWNDTDANTKSVIVAESNFLLKEAGVLNATFCVTTRLEYDPDSNKVKAKKITPIFYGEVTQFEYETVQNCAITLQTNYNFNDFAFKMKVMEISGNEDF